MKKNNFIKLFYIFLLSHPLLDLITSLFTRFNDYSITPGILAKGFFLLLLMIYVLFFSNSKYRKYSVGYLIALSAFTLLYFLTRDGIVNFSNLLKEIIYMVKYMYFPLMFIGLTNFFDDYSVDNHKIIKIFQINALFFASTMLIAEITGTSFSSYVLGNNSGTVGWYYSANEISAILTLLFPFLFIMIYETNKMAIFYIVPVILSMSLIGTKTAFIGLIAPPIFYIIYIKISDKKIFNKDLVPPLNKKIIPPLIILIIIILVSPNIAVITNFNKNINRIIENEKPVALGNDNNSGLNELVFSDRDRYLKTINSIYLNSLPVNKIFGIGFTQITNNENKNVSVNKLIEMDPFDIFFRYGVAGFAIYFLPFIIVAFEFVNFFIRKKANISFDIYLLCYVCVIAFAISIMAGHVLGAPSTSIYLAISLVMLCQSIKRQNNNESIF